MYEAEATALLGLVILDHNGFRHLPPEAEIALKGDLGRRAREVCHEEPPAALLFLLEPKLVRLLLGAAVMVVLFFHSRFCLNFDVPESARRTGGLGFPRGWAIGYCPLWLLLTFAFGGLLDIL